MTLHEFIEHLPSVRDTDVHTKAQRFFLSSRMDFLGRVETLEQDWRRLRTLFPWLAELEHINATGPLNIDSGAHNRLREIYADDYDAIEILR